jgi:release factor glutamine methyltransferase
MGASMRKLEDALQTGRLLLKEKEISDGDLDAWYLLSYYFHMNRAEYIMRSNMPISDKEYQEYIQLVQRRGNHIPLQYITGEQEFMGLTFCVSESVLIPRQDTEILVEEVLKVSKGKDVLDLCTGSGCIIISLKKLGEINNAVGLDISEDALDIAKRNADDLHAEVRFILSDMYTQVEGEFDIIVSNPPYIPSADIPELMEEVKIHEPMLALDGKSDGLHFYRIIINGLSRHLKPGGYVFLEIGYNQGEAVRRLLEEKSITNIRVIKDLAGLDRVVSGQFL